MKSKKLDLTKINPDSDTRVTIGVTTTGKNKLRLAKEAQSNDMTLSEYCELMLTHANPKDLFNIEEGGNEIFPTGMNEEIIKALFVQSLDENNPLLIDQIIDQIKEKLLLPNHEERQQVIKLLEESKEEGKKDLSKQASSNIIPPILKEEVVILNEGSHDIRISFDEKRLEEVHAVLNFRQKKGISKDMNELWIQIWDFIKNENNTMGAFKTNK
jgi:hypothetical protein